MKKFSWILIIPILLWGGVLTSCENFLNGGEIKKEIEKQIEYANASAYTIRVDSPKGRGVIKSPAGGETSKKVSDVFTVNFEPVIDWEFVRWKIIDSSTENEIQNGDFLSLSSLTEPETECTFLRAPEGEMNLCLVPVLTARPQIISYAPLYAQEGSFKDSAIQVNFDCDIDSSSIYYTKEERLALIKSGIRANQFLKAKIDGEEKYYGYKMGGKCFFKNIAITEYDTEQSLCGCFSAPVLETPRQLSIYVRKDISSDDYEALFDWSRILVSLEREFSRQVDGKTVFMATGKKWIYQVSDRTDSEGPEVLDQGNFSVMLTQGKKTLSQEASSPASDSVPSTGMRNLMLNLKVKDSMSGPADSFTVKLQRSGSSDVIQKDVRFRRILNQTGYFSGMVDLSSLIFNSGIYGVSFVFRDMSGNQTEYPKDGKKYYFAYSSPYEFLMPVEDVFSIAGRGTIITGRVDMGSIKSYDSVQLVGYGKVLDTTVIQIEKERQTVDNAVAGDSVGILLRAVNKSDVKRGMCLCLPGDIQNHSEFGASICLVSKDEAGVDFSLSDVDTCSIYLNNVDVQADVLLSNSILLPGECDDDVIMCLSECMPVYEGQSFLIRMNGRTLGSGTIHTLFD
ncbi:MAG: hypothetical protein ILP07_07240 [Treponema sp.]|nr:hypothetical protein [Treponema sp.]